MFLLPLQEFKIILIKRVEDNLLIAPLDSLQPKRQQQHHHDQQQH